MCVQRYDDLARALSATEANRQALADQLAESEAQISSLSSELRAKDQELNVLAGKHDKIKSSRGDLLHSIQELEMDLNKAKAENDRYGQIIATAHESRSQERATTQKVMDDVRAAEDRVAHAQTEAERVSAQLKARGVAHDEEIERYHAKHKLELQSLLAYVRYLKASVVRKEDQRRDAAWAKRWVSDQLVHAEASGKRWGSTLVEIGLLPAAAESTRSVVTPKTKMVGAFKAVGAMVRMQRMAHNWSQTRKVAQRLREAPRLGPTDLPSPPTKA